MGFAPDEAEQFHAELRQQIDALVSGVNFCNGAAILTTAQKVELASRLLDDIANPDDVEPWESVRADALADADLNKR